MIIPVVITPWRAVRFLLIVMATIFGTFVGMYVMQAAIEPVSKSDSHSDAWRQGAQVNPITQWLPMERAPRV